MPRAILNFNNEQIDEETVVSAQAVQEEPANVEAPVQQAEAPAEDPYAHMFAEWDLVPPQLVIRRIHRKTQR